ncbi:hypothetical protein ACFO4E_15675 [Nocardiopsis mangrovi]|uniref:DUF3311 domain-containing protein n=1 Tax=Nocardiopsis mangrovi TaxID=1179818 RepID=A0ABV9DX47_9ACTN
MTRTWARIALVICVVLWLVAAQQAGARPVDFYYQPITAFLLYFGPLIALVFLVLSFVGRKDAARIRRGPEQNREDGSEQ